MLYPQEAATPTKLPAEAIFALLDGAPFGRLATYGPGPTPGPGRSYVVPLQFLHRGGAIYLITTPGRKLANLRATPHGVCFQLDLSEGHGWTSVCAWGDYRDVPDLRERLSVLTASFGKYPGRTSRQAASWLRHHAPRLGAHDTHPDLVVGRIDLKSVSGRSWPGLLLAARPDLVHPAHRPAFAGLREHPLRLGRDACWALLRARSLARVGCYHPSKKRTYCVPLWYALEGNSAWFYHPRDGGVFAAALREHPAGISMQVDNLDCSPTADPGQPWRSVVAEGTAQVFPLGPGGDLPIAHQRGVLRAIRDRLRAAGIDTVFVPPDPALPLPDGLLIRLRLHLMAGQATGEPGVTGRDLAGLLISFLYPTVLLVSAELIRRRAGWAPEFTRKLVHIGAGMWVFGALALFDHWWAALIATTSFIGINWLSARRTLIPAMDAARAAGLGTVWFMVSFTVLLGWFWSAGRPYLAAAAMMALTWGDAAAAIVGRAWGRHRYEIGGQTRSLEGSAALAGATFLAVTPTLALLAPDRYPLPAAAGVAALVALVAAVLEPAAPRGQDNLSVPIGAGVVLWLIDTGRLAPLLLLAGLALSAGIGLVAYRAGSLTPGGVLGAILVGTATFACGGWAWGLLLIVFFMSSSALGRVGARSARKAAAARAFAKGGRRDLGQALANGGVAALLAVGAAAAPPAWASALLAAYVGTLAAVTADTWGTELGVLSRAAPRLLVTGRVVPAGTSGAVSPLGFGAALAGAVLIGLAAWGLVALWPASPGLRAPGPWLLGAALGGGLLGMLVDSLLGATVQQISWCPHCGQETERHVHACGTPTQPRRGLAWVDNEAVNLGCALAGALAGVLSSQF